MADLGVEDGTGSGWPWCRWTGYEVDELSVDGQDRKWLTLV